MSRLLTQFVRLLKFGAVAGALVGVGRMVMRRRQQAEESEASWPTIAETAASNGQPVDPETGDGSDTDSDGDGDSDDAATPSADDSDED